MAEMNKIKSFKSFSDIIATESAAKLEEENNIKRTELSTKIASILDSMEITSLEGLEEDQKSAIIKELFGDVKEEDVIDVDVVDQPLVSDEPEEEIEEDTKLEERNAFLGARAKAIEEDLEEFEFNGKTYPVTVNESTVLNEGTRGQFGKIDKKGNITSVYTHYDSYPDNVLPLIKKGYKNVKAVDAVISGGANSGLEATPDKMNFYNDDFEETTGTISKIKNYLKSIADESGAEYAYLYDERIGKWMMADIYGETGLVKAFESVSVEEATVVMDATDPKSKDLAKLLKKNKVTMEILDMEGPSGFPEIELKGKRKDLVAVLSSEDGWDDADLAEYIEESKVIEEVNEGAVVLAKLKKDIIYLTDMMEDERMYGDPDMKEIVKLLKANKLEDAATEFLSSFADQDGGEGNIDWGGVQGDVEQSFSEYVTESLINEAVTIFEKDLADMIKEIKKGYGWIDPEYVGSTWESMSNSISFDLVQNEIYKRLIAAGLLATPGEDEEEAGTYIKSLKELGIKESVVNEAEVTSDEEFKEYATTILKKAFGDDFDEDKANDVIDGILSKVDGDYGAAVGMLTSSLGESVELDEKIDEIPCKEGKNHDWKQIDKDGTSQCNNCGLLKSE